MKIGHFQSSFFPRLGGVPGITRSICQNLNMHQHVIFVRDLYKYKPPNEIKRDRAGYHDFGYADVYKFYQPLPEKFDSFETVMFSKELINAINDSDIDVLIIHQFNFLFENIIDYIEKPVIVRSTSFDWKKVKPEVFTKVNAIMHTRKHHTNHPDGYIIYPFIDYDVFKSWENGDDTITYTGRIAPEKGLQRLIPLLGNRKLKILGEADHEIYLTGLKQQISDHNADVEIIPTILDVEEYAKKICESKYFIIPSPKESYCMSLLESMSCNRVCLSLNTKGLDWAAGQYYDVNSLENIEQFQPKGRQWVLKHFDKDKLTKQWNYFLNMVL